MPAYTSDGNCDNYARYASYASYASYVISQGIHVFRPSPIFVVFRGGGPTRPGYSCIQAKPNFCSVPGGGSPHAQGIRAFRPSPNICIIPGETHTPRVFLYSGQAQYLYYSGGNPHAQGIRIFRPCPIFVLFRGENPYGNAIGTPWYPHGKPARIPLNPCGTTTGIPIGILLDSPYTKGY